VVNVNLGIWNKLTGVVVFLCFIAVILLVGIWYLPLIQQNERMRKYMLSLDDRIQKQEETGKQMRAAFDALRYDPKAVERLAREKFGYAKPGETVVRFGEPQTNYPASR
jgi:cell division protein FtsB